MNTKIKKTKTKKQPKKIMKKQNKRIGKSMKDKSVKQNVNVNVTSSGGGGSGGSTMPTYQPIPQQIQQPQSVLSSFKQAEKLGESSDIKKLTDSIKNFGIDLSSQLQGMRMVPLFENDDTSSEISIITKPSENSKSFEDLIVDNKNEENLSKDITNANYTNVNPQELKEDILNNPQILTEDEKNKEKDNFINFLRGIKGILNPYEMEQFKNQLTENEFKRLQDSQNRKINKENKKISKKEIQSMGQEDINRAGIPYKEEEYLNLEKELQDIINPPKIRVVKSSKK